MTRAENTQAKLRRSALAARRALSDQDRIRASSVICERIIRSHEFHACRTLVCYLPLHEEVDPSRIIARAWRANKRVFVPETTANGTMIFRRLAPDTPLRRNSFGIWEPATGPTIAPGSCDLVITPVVAFDDNANRVGMGSGYFDRCFAFLKHRRRWLRPKLTGIAFHCQKVAKIPPNPWDIPLYRVITERR